MYFDLFQPKQRMQSDGARQRATNGITGVLRQLLIYLGLLAGVVLEPLIGMVRTITAENVYDALAWPHALVSAIIALAIFPGVYRSTFDPEQPVLSQAGTILMAGIGWRTFWDGAAIAAGLP